MASSMLRWLFVAVALLVLLPTLGWAAPAVFDAVPHMINYQGRLTEDTGAPITGNRPVVFSLYSTASGGSALWTEGQTVTFTDGAFSVELGSVTAVPDSVFFTTSVYLGVTVDADAEMAPRQRLMSVGYAYRADSAKYADNAANAGTADYAMNAASASSAVNSSMLNNKDAAWYAAASHDHDAAYVNETDHTKAAHDTLGIDADLLDGQHASEIIDAASDEVRRPIKEVPLTITLPGSYYLTGNLTYTGLGTAITVSADDVTIDMMGYTLDGLSGNGYGISIGNRADVEIRNGIVRDFGHSGIYGPGSTTTGHRIINMRVVENGYHGIWLEGKHHLVKDCTLTGNAANGCYVSGYSTITGNTASENGSDGIEVDAACIISANTALSNAAQGIDGGYGSKITGNLVVENSGAGIVAASYCEISGNDACFNDLSGIWAGSGCGINDNTLNYNNQLDDPDSGGMYVADNDTVRGNSVSYNNQNNILVSGSGNAVEENLVVSSPGYGIQFWVPTNFYANNRASANGTNYGGSLPTGSGDGGGNASF